MKSVSGRHKILLHLEILKNLSTPFEEHNRAPHGLCQNGISEAIDLSQGRTSHLLRDLKKDGLINEDVRRVVGYKRRRKVYTLTFEGLEKARRIRKGLEKERVIIKKDSSDFEIKLEDIDSHLNSQNALLVALNNINDDRVIDLSGDEKQGKEEVFVGREDEINFLLEKLDKVSNGTSSTVLIKGKAGIGKTRLVNEFKQKAIASGFEFLMGKGYYNISEPYLPFKEAFEIVKERDENKITPLKFSQKDFEEREKNNYSIKEVERKRDLIFSDTAKNIEKLADNMPLVIFIDDLQWADKATLMLFYYLSNKLTSIPLLLIGALRPWNITNDDFLNEVLQRMRKENLFTKLELDPLKMNDTKEIAQRLIGIIDVPKDFSQLVHCISEGNPLFLKETIQQLLEEGIIDIKNNKFPINKEDIEMPEVVEDIIERRIRKLNSDALKILQTGSIIGEEIQFSLLQSVTNVDPFDLLESVDILTGMGIWDEDPKEDRIYFSHGLIHQYIYENIPNSLKKILHEKVGKSMEVEFKENLENYYSNIGFHYKRANKFEKGFEYYKKAGERAETVYAHEDAIEMYKKALTLSEKGNIDKNKRWMILEKIGDIFKIIGKYDESQKYYDNILPNKTKTIQEQRIYRKIANLHERKGNFDEALEIVERGLKEGHEENIEICRLLCRKGMIEIRQGMYDLAEKDFLQALNISEKIGGNKEMADIQRGLGIVYNNKGRPNDSLNHLKAALELLEKIGDLERKASVLNNLGKIFLKQNDLNKALEYYKQSLELRNKVGDKRDIATTLNNMGVVYIEIGDMEKSIKYYQKSHDICKEIKDQQGVAGCLMNIGDYYEKMGKLDTALKKLGDSLKICEEIDFKIGEVICLVNIGSVYLQKNEVNIAERYFEKSLAISQNYNYRKLKVYALNGLSKTYIQQNKLEKALEKGKKALDISEKIGVGLEEGMSHYILGRIYQKRKEWDKVREEFKKANKMLENAGKRSELAELLYHYALFWKDNSDEEKFRKYMGEAYSMFKDMGMKLWIEKCEEELNS